MKAAKPCVSVAIAERAGVVTVAVAALVLAAAVPARSETAAQPTPAATAPAARSSHLLNGVVATIDGGALTLRELRRFRDQQAPFLPPEARGDYQGALDAFIESRLLEAEFDKADIKASDEDVNRYIDNVLARQKGTREQVVQALEESGLTWDDYFERMRGEMKRIILVDMTIRSRINVTSEEVERHWKEDPQYLEGAKVEIAHIFFAYPPNASEVEKNAVRAHAEEVYEDLSGWNFARTAREVSEGPTASEDGYLGKFVQGTMAPWFEKAVEGLDEGDISRPVESPEGVHIVRVLSFVSPERVPLEKVEERIRTELFEQRLNERFSRWAREDLRKTHYISVHLTELALLAS
jgi:peptidyl-prolyl cis-trans isomerase SurA